MIDTQNNERIQSIENMSTNDVSDNFEKDLDEYETWIGMGWGVNRYEDDDILPIISMRDGIHEFIELHHKDIQDNQIKRLRELDRKWQGFIEKNHDPIFRFNFRDFDKKKVQWWWWIDRLDELSNEERATL